MQGIEKHINYIMNTIQQMQNIRPSKQLMAQCLLKVNSLGRKKKKKKKEKTTHDFERLRRHKNMYCGHFD